MTGAVHSPDPSTWQCTACQADWPCPPRRDALDRALGNTPTAIEQLMHAYLLDALAARPDLPPSLLRERHLGWVRVRYQLPIAE